MSKALILYLSAFLVFFAADFILTHIIIQHVSTRSGMSIVGFDYAIYAYTIFIAVTPLFFQKIAVVSYGEGFLFMLLGMTVAGFFVWWVFGRGHYSGSFYAYEFVSAGLCFGFVNLALMCFIRFRKSFKQTHP